MRYIALFLGSFVLVFAGTYLYVTQVEYPRKYGSSLNPPDSSKVSADTLNADTVEAGDVKAPKEASPVPTSPAAVAYRPDVPGKDVAPKASYFKLARLYSAMRPQDAASALSKLDDELVVQILSKMEERKAAKILAAMGPDRAADLTVRMLAIKAKGI
ncbi:MAG TPA: hypothetical protein EYP61_08800 [Candidatus Latescibacteria bacterium]|nr:hypothetical protein [Candidatus Latescibacterota bacterium]